ncbi:Malate dehydrogenase [Rhodovulum sp. P5]|uniref:Ldh family oxidoreductase n=1 Tax=Rhodovulum sp. P5 TaxID=1564506 RepID=UPI0009C1AC2F|nr:Ldh family oxidoreductase [Rhodovulum sp. P5]ARE42101.1 Malate dehydrogenase [Rhodovulum sp. P5]
MAYRISRDALCAFAQRLLETGGMEAAKASVVAELLTRTDEMGVTTHGTSLIPYYLPELKSGAMTATGIHEVVTDTGVTMVWDGNYLPGHWLMTQALDTCIPRARDHGIVTLALRRSHHIGCLSTLTRIAADQGLVCLIATSDPAGAWVAPYGGVEPVLTPNPFAIGYPGGDHPVLIDTCASITTVSKMREHINTGTSFAHPWMLDGQGHATADPTVVKADPPGTILPVGGLDHGHKGFALALMVEMLTQGLAGHGRADHPTRWGANVYLQVMDPAAFGGADAFAAQVGHLNDRCRTSTPARPDAPVRIPGDRVQAALAAAAADGIVLPEEVWTRLRACAVEMGIPLPDDDSTPTRKDTP